MSTHIHEVLTDIHGKLPAFLRERNGALANALKCHRRWPEEVFQRAQGSCVELCSAKAVVEKIAYTIANCVEAGLVESPDLWPGVTTAAADLSGRVVKATRPTAYFDASNPIWPARASIRLEVPPAMAIEYGAAALDVLANAVDAAVAAARRTAAAAGRLVRGVAEVMAVSPRRRARSYETFGDGNPTFASGGDARVFEAAVAERRRFHDAYRAARMRLRGLVPNCAGFPTGSWRWVVELLSPRNTEAPIIARTDHPTTGLIKESSKT